MARQTRHGQAPQRKNAMQKTSRCTPICTNFPRKRCKIQKNALQKKKVQIPRKKCVAKKTCFRIHQKCSISCKWTLLWHFCAGAVINGSAQKCQNRVDDDRPCFATNPPSTKSIQVTCITAQRHVETFVAHQVLPLHEATIHQEDSSLLTARRSAEYFFAHQFSPPEPTIHQEAFK